MRLKFFFDRIVSFIGLLFLWPVLIVTAILIWVKMSGGPVLFKQKQVSFMKEHDYLAKYRRGRSGSVSSHGITTMIKWHYKLFRDAEQMGVVPSLWHTGVNLVCGFYKKLRYVKKG